MSTTPLRARPTYRCVSPTILAFVCLTLGSAPTRAQTPVPGDVRGCTENKAVTRMPGCVIAHCEMQDYGTASMPRTNNERDHQVEGQVEKTVYRCPREKSPLELGRNTEEALKKAGYSIFYTYVYGQGARFYLTAQKGPQWVYLSVSDLYEITAVKEKGMEQVMTANADGWADQVNRTGRVSIYGINFDTGKASIRPESETVLAEVVKMLQANPSWVVLVAGHTDNVGAAGMNLTLSRQRAESVITWIAAKGVDKSRLLPAGFGDTHPVADNRDEEGRQKNRRVDLIKLY